MSSTYDRDEASLDKVTDQMGRFFGLIRVVVFLAFATVFWFALGIITYTGTNIYAADLGIMFIVIGIIHIVVIVLYLIIYSFAFIKQKVADFRP